MIFNESTYNPLEKIFNIMNKQNPLVTANLDEVNKELFLAGIAIENHEELAKVMNLLTVYNKKYNGN